MIAFDNTPVIKGQEYFQTIGADISSELISEIVFKLERQFTFKTNVPVARVKPQECLKLYRRFSACVLRICLQQSSTGRVYSLGFFISRDEMLDK